MANLDLLSKRLLVVSGKGGVGKTVISSALSLLGARAGKSVLLVKIDDQGRTAQLFGTPPLGDEIRPLHEGISAVNLDPKTVAFDFILRQLKLRRLVRHIVDSALFEAWFRVSPAIKEMIVLGKVWSLVEERTWWRQKPTWDLVVFDAPATGHGLGLLRLPEQASKLLIGPLRTSALAVQSLLMDATQTNLVLVTIPEEMPVTEAIHFHDKAKLELGMPLACVVLNAVFPDYLPGAETGSEQVLHGPAGRAALGALGLEPGLDLSAAAQWARERAGLSARYRAELVQKIHLPLLEVPFLFAEQFGFAELERVTAHLSRALGLSSSEAAA